MNDKKLINWGPAAFLISYQVILLATLPFYLYYSFPSLGIWILSFVLLYLTGLSITGGYHRLYSHRAYKTNKWVESVVLFFATMSAQGSALRWSFDHRLHHAHVDTDEDPYSINKGFWYAHCLWLLDKPRTIDPKVVSDLMRNPLVMFQHKWYPYLMVVSNAMAYFFAGWLLNDYLGAFFIVTWLRLFVLHHFTWFINSLAHTWGDKPFCQEQTAVNNCIIAFLTFGEGYHNYHHTFANDYRNGIRWFHFDPTKWLIWTLHKLKLAHNLKTIDNATIKKRMVLERKSLLMEQITENWNAKREELSKQVDELSERLLKHLSELSQLREKYFQIKKETADWTVLKEMRQELKSLQRRFRDDWRRWTKLSRSIMRLKQLPA